MNDFIKKNLKNWGNSEVRWQWNVNSKVLYEGTICTDAEKQNSL